MFQILELDTGRFVIRNVFGGYVNKNGVIKTFKSPEKAAKYIGKMNRSLSRSIRNLSKRPI